MPGINWDLSAIDQAQPLIARGAAGTWDKDQIMAAPSIITHQGKHWIHYLGAQHSLHKLIPFAVL